jgi:putative flippase GtrA
MEDERVRFVLVGGFNTVFGYAVFVALETLAHIPYLASLYGSYAIATMIAFVLHRRVTYRRSGTGRVLVDFVRFQGVYVVSLVINTIALPLLVELAHWKPTVAQAVIVVITSTVSYFGHKFFSFRRPAAV